MKKLPLIFLCVLLAAVAIAGVLMPGKANYVDTGSLQSFDTTVTAEEDYSQWQVPVLKVGGHEDPAQVYLKDLGIKVNVTGNIATTTLTMVFQNRTSLILEGELLFPLPEGVTVSGYALDINGKMRKAVPVEKAKATQVFEEIERRRVDPGLLEKVEGNNFRTRIYPIPGNGSRTISITYEQELKVENGRFTYYLPLDYKDKIEEFSLQANVFQPGGKPEFAVRQTSNIRFDQQGMNYVASFKRSAYHPQQALKFSLPVVEDVPEVLVQEIEGNYYFYVNTFVKAQSQKKTWGDTLGIVWDASWSAQNRDLLKELMVLDKIIALKKNLTIHLTTFNYTFDKIGTFTITNGNWGELRKAIEAVVYDGGTNYSSIDLAKIPANEYILFSDGLSTFSEATFACSKPLHCVVSASKADYSTLKWLAIQHEGKFINLQSLSVAAVEREVQNESLQLLGVKHSKSVREVYPGIATPVQGYASVVGITGAGPELITLQFGYGKTVTAEKQIELNPKKHSVQADVQRIWAQKALAEMDLQYDKNKALINTLGHQLGIVTRGTSLMVLETLDDYRHYNITPPEDMLTDSKEDDVKEYSDERSLFEKIRGAIDGLEYWWREKVIGDEIQEVINEDYVMLDDIAPVEEAPQVQETRPIQNEAKFTPPVVAPDEEVVEEMVSQEELQTKIAGSQNIMGDDSGEVIIIETPSTRMVKIGVVEAEDPVPVAAVEVQPSFPGGMEKFDEYIMRNISRDLEGVEGILRVNICFVVEKNGSISNVEILRDGGFPTIARAIAKAFEQMPKWDAGMTNGRAVRVLYIKPVVIRAYGATTSVTSSAITNATTRSERMVTNEVLVLERATTSATIRLVDVKQNEKYLESLTGNTKKDYATYLQLRTEYGNVPVFYFDMSNWFYSHNDKQKALLILSTIAELDLENASLFKTLAYKLKEYGAYKQEVFICKKVLDWRPMDPQSYRDYGLALADAGQYQQALDTLYAALTKPFAQSVMAKSNGIKGVLIHEINQLIALHGSKLNTKSINEPVIAEQPFDIRVVINWNRDNTDIDLHVIDPRGEKCYYSHRNTSIGGMISNDITQGFGPEEFVLEKAIPGTYEIKVKYFGDNQFKAEGPSTIMAEIYTHYATGKQERKVTTLQMTAYSKNNEGLVLIGEFEFK